LTLLFFAEQEISRYWSSKGGDTHFNKFVFETGAWGDQRLELDEWLSKCFVPLLFAKDLAKMVRYVLSFCLSLSFFIFCITGCEEKVGYAHQHEH
jgi:hypothetical protein